MAVTKTTYTQSGSTTQYAIPFEVIDAADIDVYIGGVLQLQQNTASTAGPTHPQVVSGEITQGTALTNYTVASNNATFTFNAAPSVGAFIVVERTTDDTLLETFVSGSTIRAQDLNNAFERVLFIAQEGVGIADEALGPAEDEDNAFDAKGDKISNVGDAEDDNDAVNRGQLGKVITDDLIAGEGIDLTDAAGGTNSGQQVTISAELSTASNPGVVQVNATTPITATYSNPGELELSIADGAIDIAKIDPSDIITSTEQDAGTAVSNTSLFTSSAAAKRFDTIVQTTTPSGTNWEVGKTWLQNDADKTLSIWDGDSWEGISSGGTFTSQARVVYVDAANGNDENDGHRISRPKATIKAAVEQINADATFGDGSVVVVAPGIYQEVAPIDIQRNNVSIVGQALRSCIVHPTSATETNSLFRVNSGSYIANLTFTGVQAAGTRGDVGSIDPDATFGLPPTQGWNVSFLPNATIVKSPYIQNCTNFSDSEIDNDALNAFNPAGGSAGDDDSEVTGGGLLVDGSVVAAASPLRSMVCDSYTHVGLDGPGILVTNNGYVQATSSYAFFCHYHIKCLNGGQANLAASTTDFGRFSLIADGRSPNAIFTATLAADAADQATTFTINAPTADPSWWGDVTRPQPNMLVEINGITYPILSSVANGTGWDLTISRPDPLNRSNNLGLNGAVTAGANVEFFLRSMIASSGHTMEYVGSGTNYSALPENGGVPVEANQRVELNDGAIWTAITDHNGKFTVGDFFEVDQQLGFVTIPNGSIAFDLASDPSPELAANLDANSNRITDLADPTAAQDAATRNYVDNNSINNVVEDTTPQLGGNLDVNGQSIVSTSNGNIVLDPDGTGVIDLNAATAVSGDFGVSGDSLLGGQVFLENGTAADPILAWGATNQDTGIYSPGEDQVAISTGGTGRLFVDANGDVRIGSSAISSLQGATLLALESTGSANWIEFCNSGTTNNAGLMWTDAGAAENAVLYYDNPSQSFNYTSEGTHRFRTNGSERLRIDSSGRVGIGTSSPSSKLHVSQNTAGTTTFINLSGDNGTSDGGAGVNFRYNETVKWSLFTRRYSSANKLYISTGEGDANSSKLTITEGGNVGIGTTSPGGVLHVREGTDANLIFDADGTETAIQAFNDAGSALVPLRLRASEIKLITSSTERARIDSSGRLLVGTSSAINSTPLLQTANTSGGRLALGRNENAPTVGNTIGSIEAYGNAGGTYHLVGGLFIDADGSHTASSKPTRFSFNTTPSGSVGSIERVRIESNGKTKFSGSVYGNETTITASDFDLNDGNFFTCGAIAIPNPTNGVAGMSGLIRVTAAPTSFGSNWDFPGGSYTAPTAFPAVAPFYVVSSTQFYLGNWTEGIA